MVVLSGIVVVMAVLVSSTAFAQNRVEAGFERDVNRYRWTAAVYSRSDLGRWTVDLTNRFRSDAFLLFDDQLSFRDENRSTFRVARPLKTSSISRVEIFGTVDWFSLSRVFQQKTWIGVKVSPRGPFWFEPILGLAIDARPGFSGDGASPPVRTDYGPGYGVIFGLPTTNVKDYLIEASGMAQVERTNPRVSSALRSEAMGRRTFERTTVRVRLSGATVRRDAYQAASFLNRDDAVARRDETVESTRSDTLNVGLDIDSQIANSYWLSASLDFMANSRRVQTLRAPDAALFFDSDFSRRTVDVSIAGRYENGSTRLRLALIAGAEVEHRKLDNAADLPPAQAVQKLNLLRQADNDRGFFTVHTTMNVSPTRWWDLRFDGSANILRHDTPDVNPDDRDELLYNGLIGTRFRLREGLHLTIQVLGSWFHTVYIKSSRSAENSVQSSLRYRPSVQWNPDPRTRLRFSSEVRATYTVSDFILPGRRPTDQSAREVRFQFEGDRDFGEGLRVLVNTSASDLQLGRFLEDKFAEIPFDTLRTYSTWVRIQTGGKIQAELGVRLFIRTDFDRSATVRYHNAETGSDVSISRPGRKRIDQIGPTSAIMWPFASGAYLRLDGWAMLQRVSHRLYGELPEGFEGVIRRAASRGKRTVIPNLAISMRWMW